MGIRERLKKISPAYRTEHRMRAEMARLEREIREMDKKQEYLFWLSQMQPGETMQQTKERLCLQMPKATGRLRNIQLAEKHILERVKDICDENGLSLFLVGGTLLGAVRHKGFIPWDNDIDVGMMKQDYLRLRELLSNDEELRAEYYYNYEAGLRMSKVKFRAVDVFWIDIIVFDRIDADPENISEIWKELAARQEKEFQRMGKGDFFCGTLDTPFWARDPRGIKSYHRHFPLKKNAVEFEGTLYDAWNHFEEALTSMYGDYWALPRSISEPHSTELDHGLTEGFDYLRCCGIIPNDKK